MCGLCRAFRVCNILCKGGVNMGKLFSFFLADSLINPMSLVLTFCQNSIVAFSDIDKTSEGCSKRIPTKLLKRKHLEASLTMYRTVSLTPEQPQIHCYVHTKIELHDKAVCSTSSSTDVMAPIMVLQFIKMIAHKTVALVYSTAPSFWFSPHLDRCICTVFGNRNPVHKSPGCITGVSTWFLFQMQQLAHVLGC